MSKMSWLLSTLLPSNSRFSLAGSRLMRTILLSLLMFELVGQAQAQTIQGQPGSWSKTFGSYTATLRGAESYVTYGVLVSGTGGFGGVYGVPGMMPGTLAPAVGANYVLVDNNQDRIYSGAYLSGGAYPTSPLISSQLLCSNNVAGTIRIDITGPPSTSDYTVVVDVLQYADTWADGLAGTPGNSSYSRSITGTLFGGNNEFAGQYGVKTYSPGTDSLGRGPMYRYEELSQPYSVQMSTIPGDPSAKGLLIIPLQTILTDEYVASSTMGASGGSSSIVGGKILSITP